jgi:hypothetical protein
MVKKNSEVSNNDEPVDPEVQRIMKKADDGTLNVINKILNQPDVQKAIKTNISKQTFISGLFMSFFLVGFFMLFNVAKAVLNYNWVGDLSLGIVLIGIGTVYMAKQIKQK